MMLQRSSYVNNLNVKVASYSSILQLGDSCIINSFSRALAVQREAEIDYGNEGYYEGYSVFSEPIPFALVRENISIRSHHLKPIIKVNNVRVTGVSSSSVLHIGNSRHISMEARIKHVRQLLPHEVEQNR